MTPFRAPKIGPERRTTIILAGLVGLAVDLHEHLIQVPLPLDEAAHARNPLLSDLGREHRTKPVPPKSDGLMTDVDPRSAS